MYTISVADINNPTMVFIPNYLSITVLRFSWHSWGSLRCSAVFRHGCW